MDRAADTGPQPVLEGESMLHEPPVIDLVSPASFTEGHPWDQYAWLTRMPAVAPAAPLERLASSFIAGVRTMPVRYSPGPRAGGAQVA